MITKKTGRAQSMTKRFAAFKTFIAAAVILLAAGPLLAEGLFEESLIMPRVNLGAEYTPKSRFDGHEAIVRSFSLKSLVPLGGAHVDHEGRLSLFQPLLNFNAGIVQPDISVLKKTHTIETGTLGLSSVFFTSSRSIYFLSAGANLSEEVKNLSSIKPTPFALGLANNRLTDSFSLIYGAVLTYISGVYRWNFPVIPLLGFALRFGNRDTLTIMLPFSIRYRHSFSKGLNLSLFANAVNNRYRIYNDDAFINLWDRGQKVTLSLSTIATGASLDYNITQNLFVSGTAALFAGRRISFMEKRETAYTSKMKATAHIAVSAGWRFGDTERYEMKTKE